MSWSRMLTRKDLKYNRVYYGDLQQVLRSSDKVGSNSGVYGWNWDCYELHGRKGSIYILQGYRNFCGKCLPYEMTKKWNNKAREISDSWNNWKEKKGNTMEENFRAWLKSRDKRLENLRKKVADCLIDMWEEE